MVEDISMEIASVEEDVKTKLAEDLSKIRMVGAQENHLPVILEERELAEPFSHCARECDVADVIPPIQVSRMAVGIQSPQGKGLCSV